MSQYYDLNNTGAEVQERLDQVMPNKEAISQETEKREKEDTALEEKLKQYTDNETARAEGAEKELSDEQERIKQSIEDIAVSGGASVANAVVYDNKKSGIDALTAQEAIDFLAERADELGVHEESHEYIRVIIDNKGRLLFGIRIDGSIDWSVGVPAPVKEHVKKNIDSIYKTLKAFIDKKSDKEEGKSLVDAVYANSVSNVDSPEFAYIMEDADGNVLEAIKRNGLRVFKAGLDVGSSTIESEDHSEFIKMAIDATGKIIYSVGKDGRVSFYGGIKSPTIDELKQNALSREEIIRIVNDNIPKTGTSIFDFNPDSLVRPILQNLIMPYYDASLVTYKEKPLVLSYITDIHGDVTRFSRFNDFNNKYSGYLNDVFLNGDIAPSWFGNFNEEMKNIDGWSKMLKSIGNHDAFDSEYHYNIDNKDIYDKFFDTIRQWGVTQPSGADSNGLCYYYKDYSDNNIRLIVLDSQISGSKADAQLSWFKTALSGAKDLGYSVVAAQHIPVANTLDWIECNFTSPEIFSYGGDGNYPNLIQAVDNFITEGGEFVCWLHGHTHTDYIGTVPLDYKGLSLKQKQLCLVIAAGTAGETWQDTKRVVGTKSEDLFTIISFETIYKHIKIFRVGAEWNQFLQHKTTLVIDYKKANIKNFN